MAMTAIIAKLPLVVPVSSTYNKKGCTDNAFLQTKFMIITITVLTMTLQTFYFHPVFKNVITFFTSQLGTNSCRSVFYNNLSFPRVYEVRLMHGPVGALFVRLHNSLGRQNVVGIFQFRFPLMSDSGSGHGVVKSATAGYR